MDALFHVSNAVLIVSYIVWPILALRLFAIAGSIVGAVYTLTADSTDGNTAINATALFVYYVVFGVVNIAHAGFGIAEWRRARVKFNPEHDAVYSRLFGSECGGRLTRPEFDDLAAMNHRTVYTLRVGNSFATPGMESHALSILVSGSMGVFHRSADDATGGDNMIGTIQPFEFIDSPEYFMRKYSAAANTNSMRPPAAGSDEKRGARETIPSAAAVPPVFAVTLRALSDCKYLSFSLQHLDSLFASAANQSLALAVHSAVAIDVARKVYTSPGGSFEPFLKRIRAHFPSAVVPIPLPRLSSTNRTPAFIPPTVAAAVAKAGAGVVIVDDDALPHTPQKPTAAPVVRLPPRLPGTNPTIILKTGGFTTLGPNANGNTNANVAQPAPISGYLPVPTAGFGTPAPGTLALTSSPSISGAVRSPGSVQLSSPSQQPLLPTQHHTSPAATGAGAHLGTPVTLPAGASANRRASRNMLFSSPSAETFVASPPPPGDNGTESLRNTLLFKPPSNSTPRGGARPQVAGTNTPPARSIPLDTAVTIPPPVALPPSSVAAPAPPQSVAAALASPTDKRASKVFSFPDGTVAAAVAIQPLPPVPVSSPPHAVTASKVETPPPPSIVQPSAVAIVQPSAVASATPQPAAVVITRKPPQANSAITTVGANATITILRTPSNVPAAVGSTDKPSPPVGGATAGSTGNSPPAAPGSTSMTTRQLSLGSTNTKLRRPDNVSIDMAQLSPPPAAGAGGNSAAGTGRISQSNTPLPTGLQKQRTSRFAITPKGIEHTRPIRTAGSVRGGETPEPVSAFDNAPSAQYSVGVGAAVRSPSAAGMNANFSPPDTGTGNRISSAASNYPGNQQLLLDPNNTSGGGGAGGLGRSKSRSNSPLPPIASGSGGAGGNAFAASVVNPSAPLNVQQQQAAMQAAIQQQMITKAEERQIRNAAAAQLQEQLASVRATAAEKQRAADQQQREAQERAAAAERERILDRERRQAEADRVHAEAVRAHQEQIAREQAERAREHETEIASANDEFDMVAKQLEMAAAQHREHLSKQAAAAEQNGTSNHPPEETPAPLHSVPRSFVLSTTALSDPHKERERIEALQFQQLQAQAAQLAAAARAAKDDEDEDEADPPTPAPPVADVKQQPNGAADDDDAPIPITPAKRILSVNVPAGAAAAPMIPFASPQPTNKPPSASANITPAAGDGAYFFTRAAPPSVVMIPSTMPDGDDLASPMLSATQQQLSTSNWDVGASMQSHPVMPSHDMFR